MTEKSFILKRASSSVPQNKEIGMKHATKYGESAERTLGTCYENGMGTAVDMERAVALYRDAARLGSGLAKKALSRG